MTENNSNADKVAGFTNTGYVAFDNQWCAYRLPCGLCTRTMQQCPKYGSNEPIITYTTATSTANAGEQLKINL